jgi:hypothetical protein
MSDKWIEELSLLYESDPRQITPHRASGMGPTAYDPRNSWSGKVGISDGTASTRAAATPYQQSFIGEMEEDENKIMSAIQKIEDQFNSNSDKDKSVRYALGLLKKELKRKL